MIPVIVLNMRANTKARGNCGRDVFHRRDSEPPGLFYMVRRS